MYTAPCKDCPDRHELCHSTCEKYLTYKKNFAEAKEKLRELKRLDAERYKNKRRWNGW